MFNCTFTVQSPKYGAFKCAPVQDSTWICCGDAMFVHFEIEEVEELLEDINKGAFYGLHP